MEAIAGSSASTTWRRANRMALRGVHPTARRHQNTRARRNEEETELQGRQRLSRRIEGRIRCLWTPGSRHERALPKAAERLRCEVRGGCACQQPHEDRDCYDATDRSRTKNRLQDCFNLPSRAERHSLCCRDSKRQCNADPAAFATKNRPQNDRAKTTSAVKFDPGFYW